MVFITIDLSLITIPINSDIIGIIDILSDLRDKVLEVSLKELDEKFGSDTWCFISRIRMPQLPCPRLRIFMEVNDYYDYPDLTADVTQTFEKHWSALIKTVL
jgi:hypothetical protein